MRSQVCRWSWQLHRPVKVSQDPCPNVGTVVTDDPFWKKPWKIPNVLKLDESMKFSPYHNLISAGIIRKSFQMIGSSISRDEAIWASIPAFGVDAGWNTTTSLHTYHRNGQDLQHHIFGLGIESQQAQRAARLNTSCCCLQAFPCRMWTFLQDLLGIAGKGLAKMQHTRYTVYTWSHVYFLSRYTHLLLYYVVSSFSWLAFKKRLSLTGIPTLTHKVHRMCLSCIL